MEEQGKSSQFKFKLNKKEIRILAIRKAVVWAIIPVIVVAIILLIFNIAMDEMQLDRILRVEIIFSIIMYLVYLLELYLDFKWKIEKKEIEEFCFNNLKIGRCVRVYPIMTKNHSTLIFQLAEEGQFYAIRKKEKTIEIFVMLYDNAHTIKVEEIQPEKFVYEYQFTNE